MPRIAAVVCTLALIVASIGFNIRRYPVVWQMVGPSSPLPQSRHSAQPIAAAESTTAAPHSDAPAGVDHLESDAGEPFGRDDRRQDDRAEHDKPSWSVCRPCAPPDARGYQLQSRAEATVLQEGVSSADPVGQSRSGRALVPVVVDSELADAGAVCSASGAGIRRLPPTDNAPALSTDLFASQTPDDPIPFYPTTGID